MKFLIIVLSFLSSISFANVPQVVPIPEDMSVAPQLEFAGVGIATVTQGKNSEHKTESGINVSDSSLLIGASQRLFDGAIGSFGFGSLTTDANNSGTSAANPYFVHQSFVDYQSEKSEFLVGRSDNQTAHIVDFPTIREEDLITLTNPLNPLSDGKNREEHRFANVAAFTLNQNLSYFENFHAQHLVNSVDPNSQTGMNSYGATFQYLASPGLEALERVPAWGLGVEHLSVDANSSGLTQIYGGAVINLNESVTHKWDLRFQEIVSLGSDLETFSNVTDSYQANSHALAVSLRYLDVPFGGAGYQVALTGAHKDYFKVHEAKSTGVALTGVKRLGGGFDFIAQYQGQWRQSALAAVQSNDLSYENIFEIGLSFNFDAIINQHLSPRRSLLNQQHQYIPN
jgi:hypothetical protein